MTKLLRIRNLIVVLLIVAITIILMFHKQIISYYNIRTIVSEQLDSRLVPHRVNRAEKLSTFLDQGIRSLEMDLIFRAEADRGYFEVGHDEADARGVRLDEFLETIKPHDPKKLWLDIKNVSADNIDAVNRELLRLDSVYGIKRVAIVESGTTDSSFARISRSGFQTSYYLPTERISGLLAAADQTGLQQEAERIKMQIESQAVSAVSFSLSIYPFVKKYLEPLIDPGIAYHTWDSVDMRSWNGLKELKGSDYYQDPRVKTIIYRF